MAKEKKEYENSKECCLVQPKIYYDSVDNVMLCQSCLIDRYRNIQRYGDIKPPAQKKPEVRRVRIFKYMTHLPCIDGKYQKEIVAEGIFRQYGVDAEESETGFGNYSTAIVEKDNGEVENVPVDLIQFINP
jgi:hypothetical protein